SAVFIFPGLSPMVWAMRLRASPPNSLDTWSNERLAAIAVLLFNYRLLRSPRGDRRTCKSLPIRLRMQEAPAVLPTSNVSCDHPRRGTDRQLASGERDYCTKGQSGAARRGRAGG